MNKHFTRISYSLLRFVQLQLFLSLATLPILVSWGLPLSAMSAVGNFVFSPFLSIFLLCSSLIFFTELLYIPNSWLIVCLEKITNGWMYCLSFGSKSWLIGFYKPSLWILCLFSLCAFLIVQHKKSSRLLVSLSALLILLTITTTYLNYTKPCQNNFTITCGRKEIAITLKNNKVTLHDNGAFAKKLSPRSWVQFTLLPELIKKAGITTLETIIVEEPNTLTFEALVTLCEHVQIKTIELPYFDTELSKSGWRQFFALKQIVEKEGIILARTQTNIVA